MDSHMEQKRKHEMDAGLILGFTGTITLKPE